MFLLEVSVSFPSLIMASAIAPFKCCYASSMAPHGLRTQLGGSIRNRNITVYPLYCCCCSVAQLYPTLCNPMNCSTSGFPVLHYFPECAQTHVLWVSDAIPPFHPLLPSCPQSFPASVSWLSTSGGQSVGASASASILPMNIQGWFPLGLTGLILTCSINMLFQKRSHMCHIHTLVKKKSHCAMGRGEQSASSGRDPTPVLPSALRSRPKWWWPSCKA